MMLNNDATKQTLFISYCWNDGTLYADELEKQLCDRFDVKRDKSQLNCNDDIDAFMRKIAECDNVVIVLTKGYLKSLNCMKEVTYLTEQLDWPMKSIILVVDDEIYGWEKQKEVIYYWIQRRDNFIDSTKCVSAEKLFDPECNLLERICNKLEDFFIQLKKRNNPSQIAVVNEIIQMSKRDKTKELELVDSEKQKVEKIIKERKLTSIKQINEESKIPMEAIDRLVGNLSEEGKVANFEYGEIIYIPDKVVADDYLRAKGKKSLDELDEYEYDEMLQAIANVHHHM